MLKIIDNLAPFFEDCYRRINVREYGRMMKVSAPTASKMLKGFRKEGLLKLEKERVYDFYFADKDCSLLKELSKIYWEEKLRRVGLIEDINKKFSEPVIVLFGSLSKAEATPDSDVDIAVFSFSKKEISFEKYEKKLKRKIQLFLFQRREDVRNKELLNNILNGHIVSGIW